MDNQKELKLLHPRSIAAVVRDGYRLYMASFRSLFRSSWIVAIVYAIAFALMMGNVVNNIVPMQATIMAFGAEAVMANPATMPSTSMSVLFGLFFLVAVLLLAAQAISLFREHQATDNVSRPAHWYGRLCMPSFLRLLAVALWLLVIDIVITVLFAGVTIGLLSLGVVGNVWKSIASLCLMGILSIVVMVLIVPLAYTVMRTLLLPRPTIAPPFNGYLRGMRHWGLLFATIFVVYIFTCLLTLVCELPAVIITIANTEAYAGLAVGDPLGLPDNIVPLTYCVFILAGFIQAYVHLSTLFPIYYAYGSIEQQKAERLNIEQYNGSQDATVALKSERI